MFSSEKVTGGEKWFIFIVSLLQVNLDKHKKHEKLFIWYNTLSLYLEVSTATELYILGDVSPFFALNTPTYTMTWMTESLHRQLKPVCYSADNW